MFFLLKKKINNFDAIHTVGASFSGIVGSFLSKKTKTPHISQCIGSDVNFSLPKIKNSFGVKNWEKHVNIFTCNSKALSERVHQLYPDKRSEVIYRGVNLNEFRPNVQKYSNPSSLTCLFIGGLSKRSEIGFGRNLKGGITLLHAWKEAFSTFKKKSKPKLIFGGPEVTRELVCELLQLNDFDRLNIEVVGNLNKEKVVSLMSDAHLVIIPSMQEGLPNVAFETYASGCALIASNVGGIPEIVENNINGLLCKSGNENELAEAILFAVQNPDWVVETGKQNRTIAEERYDSKNFTQKYLELYQWLKKE
ncbi:MAG: glycosyltransferase family 4 protein [Arcobacteraceae bacterium]|nr:glycosyltransferase family 4 protein [Arcobacteraceae bacterium]